MSGLAPDRRFVVLGPATRQFRLPRRGLTVSLLLLLGIAGLSAWALLTGDYPVSFSQVLASFAGTAEDPLGAYFVTEVRAPRVVAALVVGAALGLSGSIFQVVSGNPLGSPDIIGFTTGAASGALLSIVILDGGPAVIATGAILGGLGTAVLVYGLASHHRTVAPYRLVLVGIGIGAGLAALNALLLVRASLTAAQTAAQWLAGSLNAMTWPRVELMIGALVLLSIATLAIARPLHLLAIGDDVARGNGVEVHRVRLLAVLIGVALMATATATAGPIAFVALAAPQIARRLTGVAVPPLIASALTGAFLVLVSDRVAVTVIAPDELAVGVVTGAVGGAYLVVLLVSQWRRK
ncbi:FecCD family ABC transporter permease [Nocardioides sp. Bht2]|uniref:FecCD family ABC transporter permease n=1 Tax=Nocardioides sp. Bht2 TaxID=3392297 RepID=UPI0039B50ED6